jgi:hypothetical protein
MENLPLPLIGAVVSITAVWMAYNLGYTAGFGAGRDAGFEDGKKAGAKQGAAKGYAIGFDRGKHAREAATPRVEQEPPFTPSARIPWGIIGLLGAIVVVFFLAAQSRQNPLGPSLPIHQTQDSVAVPISPAPDRP